MPAAMKQLLWICAGILLTFTAVLGAFHLFYDYEYRKIRPLCGAWHSTLDDTRLVIEPCGDKFRITITRRGTSETHALHYKDCVYYTAVRDEIGIAYAHVYHVAIAAQCLRIQRKAA